MYKVYRGADGKIMEVESFDVDWNYLSIYEKLSDSFIIQYQDKLNLNFIATYQELSAETIRELNSKLDSVLVYFYQR